MVTTLPPWSKRAFAAPNALYRHGLGGLLGRRFLQLTHVGRKSGTEHTVVLEVLRYDRDTGEAVVISGFGESAQWLRNLRANGDARISFGRTPRRAELRVLDPAEAVDVMTSYERGYGILRPALRRTLTLFVGFDYRGTDEDRRRLVEKLPLIAFRPAGTGCEPDASPGSGPACRTADVQQATLAEGHVPVDRHRDLVA